MANSIVQKQFHSIWRNLYILGTIGIILWWLAYGLSFLANMLIQQRTNDKQQSLEELQKTVDELGTEKSFFSYNFAKDITTDGMIKRSDHIRALIDVLNSIEDTSYVWSNAIKLTDFTISPDKITLKGKVNDLLLLYYSSPEHNFVSVIDRFTSLSFVSNVSIKQYTKSNNAYAFTLTADIDLHAALQSEQSPTISLTDTWSITPVTTGDNQ